MKAEAEDRETREARLSLQEATAEIARLLKETMPPGVGFALIMCDFGVAGSFAYAATVNREDMIRLYQEAIEKLRGGS